MRLALTSVIVFIPVSFQFGRDVESVRIFGAFICDLQAIMEWLTKCRIEIVALGSTGVYWKDLFNMLVQSGFEVYLVNARHTRNVTGKKTDESDVAWIQRLHSCGLLNNSFLPDDQTETLRTIVRHRRNLTKDSSTFILASVCDPFNNFFCFVCTTSIIFSQFEATFSTRESNPPYAATFNTRTMQFRRGYLVGRASKNWLGQVLPYSQRKKR